MTIVFDNESLVPNAWRTPDTSRAVRVFNPGLLRDGNGWLFAYRVVSEPELRRRIALCRLDDRYGVIPGSPLPLTDFIQFDRQEYLAPEAATWFADPRFYRLEGRLFIYWNSGWHEPQNHQFLQELDPETLRPIGTPRELRLRGERQKLEKNWTLFECDGLYAVYSINPHRVLMFSLTGNGPIDFADATPPVANPGGFARLHGGLRGGAPPQLCDGQFYSFCHSVESGIEGYRYVAAVYRFAAGFPFAPANMPQKCLPLDVPQNARRVLPKLNPAVDEVVYPAGAAYTNRKWIISFGIDDERCAIAVLEHAAIVETLVAVSE